jgi:hypothetical protein
MHIRQQIRKLSLISYYAFIALLSMSVPIIVSAAEEEPTRKTDDAELRLPTAPGVKSERAKPAALKGKGQRDRGRQGDVFKPSEEISEDFAAPLPVDI